MMSIEKRRAWMCSLKRFFNTAALDNWFALQQSTGYFRKKTEYRIEVDMKTGDRYLSMVPIPEDIRKNACFATLVSFLLPSDFFVTTFVAIFDCSARRSLFTSSEYLPECSGATRVWGARGQKNPGAPEAYLPLSNLPPPPWPKKKKFFGSCWG